MDKMIILEIFIIIALFYDLKCHKIPNLLNLTMILTGLGINGRGNLLDSFLGILVIIFAFVPIYMMGAVAAGDVKFLMGVGAMMGYQNMLGIVIYVVLANVLYTCLILMKQRSLSRVLKFTYDEIKVRYYLILTNNKRQILDTPGIEAKTKIPYMPAAAVGINVYMLVNLVLGRG